VRAVSPVLNRQDIRAVSDYGTTSGEVFGVAPQYSDIRSLPINPGRWFNEEDNSEHRRVCVIGWQMIKKMFAGRAAVGSTILLNGISFEVIGVVQKIGKEGENGSNGRIFVPIETMRMLFPIKTENSENAVSFMNYRPLTKELHAEAKNEVHEIIARRHGFNPKSDDVFEDWDTIDGAMKVGKIFDAMDYFLGVVGLVTLGLGAIGIINIMLVSVAERTKEIGLRKALGATHRNILTQFFIEGAFLTAFSGCIGLAISIGFVTALAQLPSPEGFDTPRIVPSSAIAAILALAVAGIAAGLYPARKAAMLPPVEALRQE
jgi:putative ABC transport system permease protein